MMLATYYGVKNGTSGVKKLSHVVTEVKKAYGVASFVDGLGEGKTSEDLMVGEEKGMIEESKTALTENLTSTRVENSVEIQQVINLVRAYAQKLPFLLSSLHIEQHTIAQSFFIRICCCCCSPKEYVTADLSHVRLLDSNTSHTFSRFAAPFDDIMPVPKNVVNLFEFVAMLIYRIFAYSEVNPNAVADCYQLLASLLELTQCLSLWQYSDYCCMTPEFRSQQYNLYLAAKEALHEIDTKIEIAPAFNFDVAYDNCIENHKTISSTLKEYICLEMIGNSSSRKSLSFSLRSVVNPIDWSEQIEDFLGQAKNDDMSLVYEYLMVGAVLSVSMQRFMREERGSLLNGALSFSSVITALLMLYGHYKTIDDLRMQLTEISYDARTLILLDYNITLDICWGFISGIQMEGLERSYFSHRILTICRDFISTTSQIPHFRRERGFQKVQTHHILPLQKIIADILFFNPLDATLEDPGWMTFIDRGMSGWYMERGSASVIEDIQEVIQEKLSSRASIYSTPDSVMVECTLLRVAFDQAEFEYSQCKRVMKRSTLLPVLQDPMDRVRELEYLVDNPGVETRGSFDTRKHDLKREIVDLIIPVFDEKRPANQLTKHFFTVPTGFSLFFLNCLLAVNMIDVDNLPDEFDISQQSLFSIPRSNQFEFKIGLPDIGLDG